VLDTGWYRYAIAGPEVRFPTKSFPSAGTTGVNYKAAREEARQIAENMKSGFSAALSNERDEEGEYAWQIKWPDRVLTLGPLVDVIKHVLGELAWGIGVPPELIEAAEVGSGWSGRKVPMIGFYTTQLRRARSIVWAWRAQIGDPLVHWNFGPGAKYEIEPVLKIPDVLNPQQPGQPGQAGPPGAAPGGQPPPPAPGPAEAKAQTGGQPPPAPGVQMATHLQLGKGGLQFATPIIIDSGLRLPFEAESPDPEVPNEPLPFDLEPEAAPAAPVDWLQVCTQEVTHLLVVGPTKSGKTTIAEVIAAAVPGRIDLLDPLWQPNHWGGLPAATVSPSGDFGPIREAIADLTAELHRRIAQIQKGTAGFGETTEGNEFERLTVLWDEVPLCVAQIREAGEFVRAMGNFGRHVNMHLMMMGQSARVGSFGLEGFGDALENFSTIYLGTKAIEKVPEWRGMDHPAVLEWQGTLIPIDMRPMRELAVQARKALAKQPEKVLRLQGNSQTPTGSPTLDSDAWAKNLLGEVA
jgi:hypothetical protein